MEAFPSQWLQYNLENVDKGKTVNPWKFSEDTKIRDVACPRQYKDMI